MNHPDKTDFQVERMILFSDAVFVIAITLLVIDLKVPEIAANGTDNDFLSALSEKLPLLFGFVISFFIIGLYRTVHHSMFGYVIYYTRKLIWLNLLYLFCIVLMPFSTAVYSEYSFFGRSYSPTSSLWNICLKYIDDRNYEFYNAELYFQKRKRSIREDTFRLFKKCSDKSYYYTFGIFNIIFGMLYKSGSGKNDVVLDSYSHDYCRENEEKQIILY